MKVIRHETEYAALAKLDYLLWAVETACTERTQSNLGLILCGSAKNEVNMTYELNGAAFVWTSCVLLVHVQGMYTGSERAARYVHCRSD